MEAKDAGQAVNERITHHDIGDGMLYTLLLGAAKQAQEVIVDIYELEEILETGFGVTVPAADFLPETGIVDGNSAEMVEARIVFARLNAAAALLKQLQVYVRGAK